nr:XrtA system polysaccharide chain length determinant [uncultured Roseateles sp.]
MELLISQILAIARRMWKYRWPGLMIAWVMAVIGVAVVFRVPDRYEASARIYVDTQSILKPLMSGLAVQPNVGEQVTMLSRTLISRPNVEKLIRMADLDLKSQSKMDQEALIESLTKTLSIQSAGRDNLYTLAYRDSEPEAAKRVIQSLVSIFIESSLGASRKDTATAATFLNEQIKGYEAKLEEAETRLKEFRLRNISMMAGDGKDSASRLTEMSAQLDRAKLELREAMNARDAAKAQLDGEKSRNASVATQSLLQESAISISTPEIDARLESQRRNLDALLQRYTEQHPDIIATRKLIKELEEQKRKETLEARKAAMAAPMGTGPSNTSMAYQEISRLLATTEVQVAGLRARVDEYSARYAQALNQMKTAPQLEAEGAQLNRDYAIHKKNYEDLVARRESAAMSGDLEVASGVADFRLIDPPRVSPQPVSPNRLLLIPVALVFALASGLFSAFAASQLRPVFHEASEVRQRTELPLLGVVSLVMSDESKRRERVDVIRFSIGVGSLVGLFAIGMTVMFLLTRQAG